MGICKGMNEWKGKQGEPGIIKSIVALFDQVAFAPGTDSTEAAAKSTHCLYVV
jgi:hypothetical protein